MNWNGILLPIIDLKCSFNGYGFKYFKYLIAWFPTYSSYCLSPSLSFVFTASLSPSSYFRHFNIAHKIWLGQWKDSRTWTKNGKMFEENPKFCSVSFPNLHLTEEIQCALIAKLWRFLSVRQRIYIQTKHNIKRTEWIPPIQQRYRLRDEKIKCEHVAKCFFIIIIWRWDSGRESNKS